MQWYCHVGGQQYGPIDEQVIHQWIGEGRLTGDDIVWHEGMAQWQRCDINPTFASHFTGMKRTISGTGGQKPNAYIMTEARTKISGNWWKFFGLIFAFSFLINIAVSIANSITQIPLAQLIIQGPMTLGVSIFYLMAARQQKPGFGTLWSGFKNFGRAFVLNLLMGIFILLWLLLLIIPGILAMLNYAMAFFILADNPQMSPMDAIGTSKKLMYGHRWKYICLNFRFLWWFLLLVAIFAAPLAVTIKAAEAATCSPLILIPIVFTIAGLIIFAIGSVMLGIYIQVSMALFYEDIHPESAAEPVMEEESNPPSPEQRI